MLAEILSTSKFVIPAISNAKACFAKGAPSAVQFWAIRPDGQVYGIGLYGGEMIALNDPDELNKTSKFVSFDDDVVDVDEG